MLKEGILIIMFCSAGCTVFCKYYDNTIFGVSGFIL